mmetsp:Transcript_25996/g.60089  ORF Transcript_25996/g.60089 Transcript_25996/m.60089 type:complete len:128 (-) Transcript_25996:16-399(-)
MNIQCIVNMAAKTLSNDPPISTQQARGDTPMPNNSSNVNRGFFTSFLVPCKRSTVGSSSSPGLSQNRDKYTSSDTAASRHIPTSVTHKAPSVMSTNTTCQVGLRVSIVPSQEADQQMLHYPGQTPAK